MISVDLSNATPLYLQIAEGVKRAIAGGKLLVGARLPSVRQLAGDLDLNLNTVARAYRQLQDEGLVRVRHGRGVQVVSDQVTDDSAAEETLRRSLAQAFAQARLEGLDESDMQDVVAECLGELASDDEGTGA